MFCFVSFVSFIFSGGGEVSIGPLAPWPFVPMENRWAQSALPTQRVDFFIPFRWCMAKTSLYAVVNCASTVVSGSLCTERNPFLPCNEAELVPRSARFVSDMIKSLLWKETKVTASVCFLVCVLHGGGFPFPFLRMTRIGHTHKRADPVHPRVHHRPGGTRHHIHLAPVPAWAGPHWSGHLLLL